jgi:hypothetical protein
LPGYNVANLQWQVGVLVLLSNLHEKELIKHFENQLMNKIEKNQNKPAGKADAGSAISFYICPRNIWPLYTQQFDRFPIAEGKTAFELDGE